MRNSEAKSVKARRRRERGMALVMVLGVLAVALLLVVHTMTVCEVISKEAYVTCKRSELRYIAESAADHALWMHITDRRLFPNRTLGESDDNRLEETDFEPWMADRREHQLYGSNTYAYIASAEKSIKLDKQDSFSRNVDIDDTETLDLINNFCDVLDDYTDGDTNVRLNGKEEEDYADEGYYAMPRDGKMQFKEEVYWIDGWQDAITSEIQIIPPNKKKFPSNNDEISFFSASASEIQDKLDCSDDELEEIIAARDKWTTDSTPIEDSLSSDLFYNIKSNFNFNESNIAQIFASAMTDDGEIRIIYSTIREVDLNQNSIFADNNSNTLSIWNRTIQ